jgi:two-component sensor histidine kinase
MAAGTASPATMATPPRKREQVLPARPDQVRVARAFLATVLVGCPAADEVILCASELATNSCLYSYSGKAGGTFTVRAEVHEGSYVWIEVEDSGGPWNQRVDPDGRPHGLDIVRAYAADSGIDGDPLTGWAVWARIDWFPTSGPAR